MQAVLESGYLTKRIPRGPSETHPYRMELLDDRFIPDIMALQDIIIGRLSRPEMLQPFSLEFMKRHVSEQGRIVGILVHEQLVAFRNIFFPAQDDLEWNLGMDIGLPAAELSSVANFQMVCVHPEFRGNDLALKMNFQALRYLNTLQTHRHICATVSPYNYWNVRILLDSGFVIRNIKKKYGGKLRFIVYRNLQDTRPSSPHDIVSVLIDNIPRQYELLQTGFSGIQINITPDFYAAESPCSPRRDQRSYNGCEVVYARRPS